MEAVLYRVRTNELEDEEEEAVEDALAEEKGENEKPARKTWGKLQPGEFGEDGDPVAADVTETRRHRTRRRRTLSGESSQDSALDSGEEELASSEDERQRAEEARGDESDAEAGGSYCEKECFEGSAGSEASDASDAESCGSAEQAPGCCTGTPSACAAKSSKKTVRKTAKETRRALKATEVREAEQGSKKRQLSIFDAFKAK